MTDAVLSSMERYRNELIAAIDVLDQQRPVLIEERDGLLRHMVQAKAVAVREAFEVLIEELTTLDRQVATLRMGLSTLDEQARSIGAILTHPDLRGDRTDEQTRMAFKRVLRLLVQRLELQRIEHERFCVAMTVYILGSLLEESCQIVPGGSEYHLIVTSPISTGYNPRSNRLLVKTE